MFDNLNCFSYKTIWQIIIGVESVPHSVSVCIRVSLYTYIKIYISELSVCLWMCVRFFFLCLLLGFCNHLVFSDTLLNDCIYLLVYLVGFSCVFFHRFLHASQRITVSNHHFIFNCIIHFIYWPTFITSLFLCLLW